MSNLIVANTSISQHNGFFSLTDLHKSSGGADKHKPSNFMRNDETKELIAELEKENTIAYHTKQGKQGGTYACRELVYRYAMWISPKFSLMVIRAFDAMNTGAIPCLAKTTPNDRTPLRQAVTALVAKYGLMHDEAYRLVHQYMGVEHIDEIALHDLPKAVAYVHSLILSNPAKVDNEALYQVLSTSAMHLYNYARMLKTLKKLSIADDNKGGNIYGMVAESYNDIVKLSVELNLTNHQGLPMFTSNAINFYHGGALVTA